jgi:hypothetical protein
MEPDENEIEICIKVPNVKFLPGDGENLKKSP